MEEHTIKSMTECTDIMDVGTFSHGCYGMLLREYYGRFPVMDSLSHMRWVIKPIYNKGASDILEHPFS